MSLFASCAAFAFIGSLTLGGSKGLEAGLHDSPVSGGPVHRRSEAVHGIQQRAHSSRTPLPKAVIHLHHMYLERRYRGDSPELMQLSATDLGNP